MRAGGRDFALLNMNSSGLWSLSSLNSLPRRYRFSLSQLQTIASASLSICEYRLSTGVSARLAYATTCGSGVSSLRCASMAPKPTGLASTETSVCMLGSK